MILLVGKWDIDDAMHLVPSDEFFIYSIRKPNAQNDIVWAHSKEELNGMGYRSVPRYPTCIGVFLMFSSKKLLWIIKEQGQSWSGEYFRQNLLKKVIPFLKDRSCVQQLGCPVFLHDKAPCMTAKETQKMLKDANIDFFDNDQWPGNSPDLNVAENLGAILMNKVDDALDRRLSKKLPNLKQLKAIVVKCCKELELETNLFQNLLKSFIQRRDAVLKAQGGHTNY